MAFYYFKYAVEVDHESKIYKLCLIEECKSQYIVIDKSFAYFKKMLAFYSFLKGVLQKFLIMFEDQTGAHVTALYNQINVTECPFIDYFLSRKKYKNNDYRSAFQEYAFNLGMPDFWTFQTMMFTVEKNKWTYWNGTYSGARAFLLCYYTAVTIRKHQYLQRFYDNLWAA